jgi:hypothetical protein
MCNGPKSSISCRRADGFRDLLEVLSIGPVREVVGQKMEFSNNASRVVVASFPPTPHSGNLQYLASIAFLSDKYLKIHMMHLCEYY